MADRIGGVVPPPPGIADTAAAPPVRGRLAFGRAFRHRNYRLFFGGQLISLTGVWIQSVAMSWLIYRLTGSATLLGLVGFASQLPVFLLTPITGAIADIIPRHRILLIAQCCAMVLTLVLASLTLLHLVAIWHIFLIAILLGLVNAFDMPTRQAFVVEMVGKEDMQNAIAMNSTMYNGARMLGPAIGGILIASIGEGWCFLVNGLSYGFVIGGYLLMRLAKPPPPPRVGMLIRIAEGVRYIRSTKPILALLLLLGLVSLFGVPYSVLMPIFARDVLHVGPSGLGYLLSAAGLGALGAAFTLASRNTTRGLGKWVAMAAGGFGLSLIALAASHWFLVSLLALVGVGYCMMLQMASSNTLIQSMVSDSLRGRVMAAYSMMIMGMVPFGALLSGTLAHQIGAPLTVAGGGAICLVGSLVFRHHLPRLAVAAQALLYPPADSPQPPRDA